MSSSGSIGSNASASASVPSIDSDQIGDENTPVWGYIMKNS
ncbi:unnamed protein product [Camellia sinensis]